MFYTVLSTKGGVGKTTISQQVVAPYIYHKNGKNEKVEIIELDNNNKSDSLKNSEILKVTTNLVNEKDDVLLEKFMEVVADDKDVVIDIGGGDDTKRVLEALKELRLEDEIIFFIPVLKDLSNHKNVIDTQVKIREWNLKAKIYFVLNRYQNINDFKDITDKLTDMNDKKSDILILQDTQLFDEITKEFEKTVYEISLSELDNKKFKILLTDAAKSKDFKKLKEIKRWISIYDNCKDFFESNLEPLFRDIK